MRNQMEAQEKACKSAEMEVLPIAFMHPLSGMTKHDKHGSLLCLSEQNRQNSTSARTRMKPKKTAHKPLKMKDKKATLNLLVVGSTPTEPTTISG